MSSRRVLKCPILQLRSKLRAHFKIVKMPKKTGKEFVWTDDETELLLNVAIDYKTKKAAECTDWESVKSKYNDVHAGFLAAIPAAEALSTSLKDFPHDKGVITKQVVTSKLKAARMKFRQAIDSGRRSGHGRVVLLYFNELCEQLWGGSPATEQIASGLESADLGPGDKRERAGNEDDELTTHTTDSTEEQPTAGVLENPTSQPENRPTSSSVTVQRRQFLDSKLTNYRQEKLTRKVAMDAQMLSCAQEELAVKKRLVEQIEQMDKQYADNMAKMSKSMEAFSGSIAEGFSLLKTAMLQPAYPPVPPSHYPHQFSHYSSFPSSSSYPGPSAGTNSCPQY